MKFEVDKQTLRDLDIFGKIGSKDSIFDLLNFTKCIGGRNKLYDYLRHPESDIKHLIERKEAIAFFQKYMPSGLDIDKNSLDYAEYYLRHSGFPTRRPSRFSSLERIIMTKISHNAEYYLMEQGVTSIVNLLQTIYDMSASISGKLKENNAPKLLVRNNEEVLRLFAKPEFAKILQYKKLKAYDIILSDYIFRYTHKRDILFFLELIYEYDVFQSVAKAAEKYQMSYPEILPQADNCLEVEGLYHLFVENAVSNDIVFNKDSNLLFVSGPNMAGKSTFLKALGVSVYLAHAGFPVPAKSMKISVLSGLCTTINIADNLTSGYSHFYAEVMRIKHVAERLKDKQNMLVIFDELFRGTNVKDAYDGTLAIVSAFSKIRNSFFIVSTHIVEVAKELDTNKNINFSYFEIKEKDGHPAYTYKLRKGVSEDRLGMYIIRKEGLIDLINNINTKDKTNDETV